MIYRALTPVANVFAEGKRRTRLWVDGVDQITFRASTKWIAFPLRLFSLCFCLIIAIKLYLLPRLTKITGKRSWTNHQLCAYSAPSNWQYLLEEMRILIQLFSVFFLFTDFMHQLDRGCSRYRQGRKQQTKHSEICPVCINNSAKELCFTKWGWLGSLSCEV